MELVRLKLWVRETLEIMASLTLIAGLAVVLNEILLATGTTLDHVAMVVMSMLGISMLLESVRALREGAVPQTSPVLSVNKQVVDKSAESTDKAVENLEVR